MFSASYGLTGTSGLRRDVAGYEQQSLQRGNCQPFGLVWFGTNKRTQQRACLAEDALAHNVQMCDNISRPTTKTPADKCVSSNKALIHLRIDALLGDIHPSKSMKLA
jgi:hypothetical protein